MKTIGDEIDGVKAMFIEQARTEPRLEKATSRVQRRLQCGYNHAALIMDQLERRKFISEPDINGHRKLL